ncbi:MAG: hypothetical protein AAGA32_07660 [Pseudomonadota bacterium]
MRKILMLIPLVMATEAGALSCLPANLAETFASRTALVAGLGHLTPLGPLPTPTAETPPVDVEMAFEGRLFGADAPETVLVRAMCFGSWCGTYPPSDETGLMIFDRTEAGLRLTVNPCGSTFDRAPTPAKIAALERCAAGICDAEEHAAFAAP